MDSLSIDESGNLILHTEQGELIQNAPIVYQEHDGRREIISGRYVVSNENRVGFDVGLYDPRRPLIIDPVLNYSTYVGGANDEFGNGMEVSVFGTDEQLKETGNGYAITRREIDEFGNDAEFSYFGTDEQLKEIEEGYAIVRWKYDEFGNQIEFSYFGTDGQLKKKNDGYAISRRKYDEFRQAIEESYWGTDEQLTERQDLGGAAIIRWEYQDDGTATKAIYLDKNEKVIDEVDLLKGSGSTFQRTLTGDLLMWELTTSGPLSEPVVFDKD